MATGWCNGLTAQACRSFGIQSCIAAAVPVLDQHLQHCLKSARRLVFDVEAQVILHDSWQCTVFARHPNIPEPLYRLRQETNKCITTVKANYTLRDSSDSKNMTKAMAPQ